VEHFGSRSAFPHIRIPPHRQAQEVRKFFFLFFFFLRKLYKTSFSILSYNLPSSHNLVIAQAWKRKGAIEPDPQGYPGSNPGDGVAISRFEPGPGSCRKRTAFPSNLTTAAAVGQVIRATA
jgi:hypothetical protein